MLRVLRRFINTPLKQHLAFSEAQLRNLRTSALISAETLLIVHVVFMYGFEISSPWGISMQPTLASEGEAIFIDKTSRRGRNIQIGDIVAFDHPFTEGRAVKRVVGMPGDFVLAGTPEAKGGQLEGMMVQVPKGHCFVAGDNQQWSRDSRIFGPLPLPLIRGHVRAVVWPPSKCRILDRNVQDYELDRTQEVD